MDVVILVSKKYNFTLIEHYINISDDVNLQYNWLLQFYTDMEISKYKKNWYFRFFFNFRPLKIFAALFYVIKPIKL